MQKELLAKLALAVVLIMIASTTWAVLVYESDSAEIVITTPTPTPLDLPTAVPTPTLAANETGEPTSMVGPEEEVQAELTNQPTAAISPTPTPTKAATTTGTPTPTKSNVQTFIVRGLEYAYSPSVISVSPSTRVQVEFRNTGEMAHNFVIDELNVNSGMVNPGESKTFEFTVPVNGQSEYVFYCSVGNHRAQGMEGRIEVTR